MIDPHRLRVFRAVVAEGSIGGAAAALGYTSSAVSQQIATLQKETGLVLVERSGRGISPTEAGFALAAESGTVFDQLARIDGLVADLRAGSSGRLRVSYFASAGATWMPSVVATISREFPDIRLDLRLVELAEPESGAPDIEIYVDSGESTDVRGYDMFDLLTEDYVAVVGEHSPFAGRAEVSLRELADEPWIDNDVARGPCRRALLDACTSAGFTPDFSVETHDYATALLFAAAGIGLTVVPSLALINLPPAIHVVPISDPTPTRAIALRRRHSVRGSRVANRVIELVVEQSGIACPASAIDWVEPAAG